MAVSKDYGRCHECGNVITSGTYVYKKIKFCCRKCAVKWIHTERDK